MMFVDSGIETYSGIGYANHSEGIIVVRTSQQRACFESNNFNL